MTTATWKQAIGGVQLDAKTVIEAFRHPIAGMHIGPTGKVLIKLTGYSSGVTMTIVCEDVDELFNLEEAFVLAVQRLTDTER
jgi:hypothetical protein